MQITWLCDLRAALAYLAHLHMISHMTGRDACIVCVLVLSMHDPVSTLAMFSPPDKHNSEDFADSRMLCVSSDRV